MQSSAQKNTHTPSMNCFLKMLDALNPKSSISEKSDEGEDQNAELEIKSPRSSLLEEIATYKAHCHYFKGEEGDGFGRMFDDYHTSSHDSNDDDKGAQELFDAAMEDRGDDAVRILEKDPNLIRIGDAIGETPLHVAVRAGHFNTALQMFNFLKIDHAELMSAVLLNEVNGQGDTLATDLALEIGPEKVASYLKRLNSGWRLRFRERDYGRALRRQLLLETNCCKSDIEMKLAVVGLDEEEDEIDVFYRAVENGEQDMIERMLKKQPKQLDLRDAEDYNVFHVAAWVGQLRTLKQLVYFMQNSSVLKSKIRLLLLHGNKHGNTPLHLALGEGHEEAACYLIKVASHATYKVNNQGYSPLSLAVKLGYVDLVRYMTTGTHVPQSTRESLLQHALMVSLAHVAVKSRNLAMLQVIMEGLPELINSPDRKGWRPLSYAASKDYIDQVSYFLENFPDATRNYDRDGSFPMHKAVAGGHKGIVEKFLLHCPKTLYDVDKKGRNIIDIAIRYNSKDVLSYLREKVHICQSSNGYDSSIVN